MLLNIIGFTANFISLVLWIPQAITTYKNKENPSALQGISYMTQLLVCMNTILWCIYGIMIHSIWLSMGTIIILPLAIFTIIIKLKNNNMAK